MTLLAGPLSGGFEDYAQTYLAGNTVVASRDEARPGARGRSYTFQSADGQTRHSLLLLQEEGRVYGVYAQGEAGLFEHHSSVLEEMARSLTLERPASYPEVRSDKFAFSLRVPPSWRSTQSFSGGGTYLMQFKSPALGADPNRQTVHASLTVTVETIPGPGDLETFYTGTQQRLGEAFLILNHSPWQGGYVDVMGSETPVAVSRMKRFYRAAEGRGYSLSFETREDVYPRVHRWYDTIAMTLKIGPELGRP